MPAKCKRDKKEKKYLGKLEERPLVFGQTCINPIFGPEVWYATGY
jgi:hypothetical protein